MTALIDNKLSTGPVGEDFVVEPPAAQAHTSKKVVVVARPILKFLGLALLLAATSALSSYALLNPVIVIEITRLIFLCMIALILQRDSNDHTLYTNTIVARVLEA